MLITAHGGAMKTHRNSKLFFDTIVSYAIDVIEVDIWRFKGLLYLSHLPSVFPRRCIPLSYAFDIVKRYGYKINCDVKQRHLVKDVLALAREKDVLNHIIFTGSVCAKDIQHLDEGEVYLNKSFFGIRRPVPFDVKTMKTYIDSFDNPRIKGINLKYTFCTEEFLAECARHSLAVSVFVVDNINEMQRLVRHSELANITTNYPDILMRLLNKEAKKK